MKRTFLVFLVAAVAAACNKAGNSKSTAQSTTTPAPAAQAVPAAPSAPPGAPGTPAASDPNAPPPAKPLPAKLPDVLAKVNGEPVERWELENAVKGIEGRAGQPIPADRRDAALRDVLSQIVDYHVMAQESRARKIDVTEAEVNARMAQMRQQFPNEDAYKQALAAQGLSPDQLTKQTRMSLQVQKLVETEVKALPAVPDADVNAFYQQNLDKFKQGETVHASHILIGVPQNATPAQKAEAKATADKVLKQVKAGGDFATLAKQNSQDPGSAPNGGDLGFFPKGQMDPTFEKTAFGLKPGTVSGVVETPFGFHIIKVIERKPPHTAQLNEVGGRIKEFLAQQQREQKITAFVQAARSKAKIDILV